MNQENIKKIKELFAELEKEVAKNSEVEKLRMGTKIYVDDDGIVHLDPKGEIGSIMKYSEIIKGYLEKHKDKTMGLLEIRVLAKIPSTFLKIPPFAVRKIIKESLKRSQKNLVFHKIAIYSGGTIAKTVVSFSLIFLGWKNARYFKTEKEALKWLKED